MDAARALREARRRSGLTQRELADRAGMPQPAVARAESGRVSLRVDTLDRLLRCCGERLDSVPTPDHGVDRAQIRERLRWTPRQRLEELVAVLGALARLRKRTT